MSVKIAIPISIVKKCLNFGFLIISLSSIVALMLFYYTDIYSYKIERIYIPVEISKMRSKKTTNNLDLKDQHTLSLLEKFEKKVNTTQTSKLDALFLP